MIPHNLPIHAYKFCTINTLTEPLIMSHCIENFNPELLKSHWTQSKVFVFLRVVKFKCKQKLTGMHNLITTK